MPRITFSDWSRGLYVSDPRDTIPRNALRKATGIRTPLSSGIRSRWGSRLAINAGPAHSLYRFNQKRYVGVGTDFKVAGGTATSSVLQSRNFTGRNLYFAKAIPTQDTDRTAFPQGPEHLFVVGGGLSFNDRPDTDIAGLGIVKLSTTNELSVIGIAPPVAPPTVRKIDAQQFGVPIDTFDIPNYLTEPTLTGVTPNISAIRQRGAGSMSVVLPASGLASLYKNLSPAKDLFQVGPLVQSSVQDWIQLWIFCDLPDNLDWVELWFDTSPADSLGLKDIFAYRIVVEDSVFAGSSSPTGTSDLIDAFNNPPKLTPEQQRKQHNKQAKDKEKAAKTVIPVDTGKIAVTALASTKLAKQVYNWTLIRIPKQNFAKVGDANWARVRQIRLNIATNNKGPVTLLFDHLMLHVGTGMSGTYKYAYRYRNSRTGTKSNPTRTDLPVDPATVEDIQRDPVAVVGMVRGNDPQVDVIDLFRTVGNGSIYFKCEELRNFATLGGGHTDIIADHQILQEPHIQSAFTVNGQPRPTTYLQAEELEFDNAQFPGTLKDIAGPHYQRMFAIDGQIGSRGRLLFSPVGRLEANEGFIDVTTDDDSLQRVIIWGGSLYCISSRFYQVQGDDVFIANEIFGVPGTNQPRTVVATPFGIIYYAADGVRVFNGAGSELVAPEAMIALFRGDVNLDPYTTPQGFIGTVAAFKDEEYYISDAVTTLAVNLRTGAWRNVGVGAVAFFVEPPELIGGGPHNETMLLASSNNVYEWEVPNNTTDAGINIPFLIETAGSLLEDQTGQTKLVQRLYLDLNCRSQSLTVRMFYTGPGGVVTLPSVATAVRQRIEMALLRPVDVVSVEISGNLLQPVDIYEIGFDYHMPEQGGAKT